MEEGTRQSHQSCLGGRHFANLFPMAVGRRLQTLGDGRQNQARPNTETTVSPLSSVPMIPQLLPIHDPCKTFPRPGTGRSFTISQRVKETKRRAAPSLFCTIAVHFRVVPGETLIDHHVIPISMSVWVYQSSNYI